MKDQAAELLEALYDALPDILACSIKCSQSEMARTIHISVDKLKGVRWVALTEFSQDLVKHIQKYGILRPISITPDGFVIDGSARVTICKRLGITRIPVKIIRRVEMTVYREPLSIED